MLYILWSGVGPGGVGTLGQTGGSLFSAIAGAKDIRTQTNHFRLFLNDWPAVCPGLVGIVNQMGS